MVQEKLDNNNWIKPDCSSTLERILRCFCPIEKFLSSSGWHFSVLSLHLFKWQVTFGIYRLVHNFHGLRRPDLSSKTEIDTWQHYGGTKHKCWWCDDVSLSMCLSLPHTESSWGWRHRTHVLCGNEARVNEAQTYIHSHTHTHTQPFQALTLQLEDTNTRILDSLVLTVMLMQMLRQALLILWGSCMNFRFLPYWEGLLTVPSNMCHYNSNDRLVFR